MDNNLQHTGVKGMRWGHRKAETTSNLKRQYDSAKAEKKIANKEFNKAWNKVTANPLNSITKKGDERWNKTIDLAEKSGNANRNFKQVKNERKAAIKATTQEMNKQASFGEKLAFNNATRKLAAKYVVDKDMSLAEAKKKSHDVAIRNTVAFLAIYGGLTYKALASK